MSKFTLLIVTALLASVFVTELRFLAPLPSAALIVSSIVAFALVFAKPTVKYFGLGFSLCVLPFFSYHVLDCFLLEYFFLSELRGSFKRGSGFNYVLPVGIILLLSSLLVAAVVALRHEFDPLS